MKSKIIFSLLLLCVFGFLLTVSAQSSIDVVYLKNGSIIKGKLIENNGETTKIQTSDGREYVFKNSEIESTTSAQGTMTPPVKSTDNTPFTAAESSKKQKYTPSKHGFWNSNDFQLWAPFGINTVNGYKFHRFGYLGIGLGLNNYTGLDLGFYTYSNFSGMVLPIYLRYGGDILNRRVTPTYFVEGGYGIVVSDQPLAFDNDPTLKKSGGTYAGAGFGFKVRTNKNISFGLSLSYKFQQTKEIYDYMTYDNNGNSIVANSTSKYDLHRVGLKVIFVGFN